MDHLNFTGESQVFRQRNARRNATRFAVCSLVMRQVCSNSELGLTPLNQKFEVGTREIPTPLTPLFSSEEVVIEVPYAPNAY